MKKGILILGIAWGLFSIGMAQERIVENIENLERLENLENIEGLENLERLENLDTIDTIDTIVVTLIMEDMPLAVVNQDSAITQLIHDKRIGRVRGEQIKDGFRVQIYASNRQQVAKIEATELQLRIQTLIDLPVYTISEPPFWKVRIGNFQTREEANNYKNILLQSLPELTSSTYVVPDKIIILQ